MPAFHQRSYAPELMDQPELDAKAIQRNFDDLVDINRLLGGPQHSIDAIQTLLPHGGSVCDVGFGAGDLLARLHASSRGHTVMGIDPMQEAHAYALARFPQLSGVELLRVDFATWFASRPEVDVIHASLFCHHLDDASLYAFIRQASQHARVGVVINDLHRHPLAYHSIRMLTHAFARSHYTKHDAPLSVLRGFRRQEWEHALSAAGIGSYTLRWKWAFRHLITIHTA